jgi:uncharacterized protein YjbI with pentapeptide repeats
LSKVNLNKANLCETDLGGADLYGADLSEADLSQARVLNTKFAYNQGISITVKQALIHRKAIFYDV